MELISKLVDSSFCFFLFIENFCCCSTQSSLDSSVKNQPGENLDDLENIEVKFDKTTATADEQSSTAQSKSSSSSMNNNNKHSSPMSTNNNPGFSLKNPVSSFRSWVTNKKSSKDDQDPSTFKKVETTPIPRKNSVESDTTKRSRTSSASITTSNYIQDSTNSQTTSTTAARAKKKSSFSLRSNNPITLLKRTSDTTTLSTSPPPPTTTAMTMMTNEIESTEQTSGTGGPLGYLKNVVRGEKQP